MNLMCMYIYIYTYMYMYIFHIYTLRHLKILMIRMILCCITLRLGGLLLELGTLLSNSERLARMFIYIV